MTTQVLVPGGTASSFQSFNYPMRYLRHSDDFLLRIDTISTASGRMSATFHEHRNEDR